MIFKLLIVLLGAVSLTNLAVSRDDSADIVLRHTADQVARNFGGTADESHDDHTQNKNVFAYTLPGDDRECRQKNPDNWGDCATEEFVIRFYPLPKDAWNYFQQKMDEQLQQHMLTVKRMEHDRSLPLANPNHAWYSESCLVQLCQIE